MQKKYGGTFGCIHFFNTVEFRICDVPMTVDETIAIAALIPGCVREDL